MKILMVSEFFYPHWTGIAKTFLAFAETLSNQHKVVVLTSQYTESLSPRSTYSNFTIFRSPCLFKFSRTNYSFKMIIDFIRLVKDADQVILNSPLSNILPLTLIAKLFGKKVMIYHQGDLVLPKLSGPQWKHRILEKIFDWMTIPAMWLADSVSTYTKDYAEHSRVMKYFMYKFVANIPKIQLVTVGSFTKTVDSIELIKRRGPVFGFAGRFVEEKGFDILLRAIPVVLKSIPNAQFVFAGELNVKYENFVNDCRKLIQASGSSLHFMGLLKEGDLTYFYKMLDLFIVSSRSDCFPVTQLEAMKCGSFSVCTNIPGARQLVINSLHGRLVQSGCHESLAAGIIAEYKWSRNIPNNYRASLAHMHKFLDKYETFRFSK